MTTSPSDQPGEVRTSGGRAPCRVIAVVNQKGGVGKTTTAVNLAACLGVSERRTLLIDMDPQGNASSAYGVVNPQRQVYDALIGDVAVKEAALQTELESLHLLPAGPDLVGAEIELAVKEDRATHLARALTDARNAYDFVIIDCPPSLGILTLNALTAADSVLIPMQCEYYALEGLARLLETRDLVRDQLNPRLELEGIVLTMVDMRNNLARQVESEVRQHFGDAVYRTRIPRNIRLSEAPSHGQPILLYDIHSRGAVAYLKLAEEILLKRRAAEEPAAATPPAGSIEAVNTGSRLAEPPTPSPSPAMNPDSRGASDE